MPNQEYVLTMARYNRWQNENLLTAADGLSDAERKQDRGAFFGSIEKTFSHLLWADMAWMHRFAGTPLPEGSLAESVLLIRDWDAFRQSREQFDNRILQWAQEVPADWFEGDISWYSGALGREMTKPRSVLVTHLFNHQTHHRGQIHAMLTLAGAKPGATDIPAMPDNYAGA